jgi:DNA-binding beta-propeller fold protein YncE
LPTRLIAVAPSCLLATLAVGCGAARAPATRQADLPLMNDIIDAAAQVATARGWTPLDAVPSPDATAIYFTVNGTAGPGIYRVSSQGGPITTLASGAPFAAPLGLTISTDGQTLYVADQGTEAPGTGNTIFALPTSGGTPTPLAATAGSRPSVPEVVSESGVDVLYYSGFDPSDGQPAIFALSPAEAGPARVVFKGAPLAWPSGVAVTMAGVIYVADMAADEGRGAVLRIQDGAAEVLAEGLRTSNLIAGAALTLDEAALLVSQLDREAGTAQVLLVNLATGDLGLINKGIAANTGAGGVHRAHAANSFAWADAPVRPPLTPSRPTFASDFSDGGGVYLISTP